MSDDGLKSRKLGSYRVLDEVENFGKPRILDAAQVVAEFGLAPCPYDTDGDGDCARCAGSRSVGCRETAAARSARAGLIYFVAFGTGDRIGCGWITGMQTPEDRAACAAQVRAHFKSDDQWGTGVMVLVQFPDEPEPELPELNAKAMAALECEGDKFLNGLEELRRAYELGETARPVIFDGAEQAIIYTADGGQALHLLRESAGFLYDRDSARLRESAALFGVRVVLIEDEGESAQRVALVGDALEVARGCCQ